ncbi:WD40/YVTN/BNR-like repeat-containing protein, partial [Planctomycetota bacterium]
MQQTKRFPLALILIITLFTFSNFVAAQDGQLFNTDLFQNLTFRHIGPGIYGGRIADIEANPENPAVIYVAASTGGVFKSVNHGITFEPIFDNAGASVSIGDMALAPSDPLILWVGTGEGSSDQSSGSIGDGVYKSIDGGQTWQNMGLQKTRHISRIVIHPTNPNIVFVGAMGALWGPNSQRGLYRTQNGGRTWEQVLYINDDTGIADVAIDPSNGNIIYASAYQRRRHAWAHVRKGPYSGLYRSTDCGDTWQKLTNGIPEGDIGRIALAIPPSKPNVVYASVEHTEGGLFRSDNRGNSWTRVNESRIYVDPLNEDKVWVMGTSLAVSEDGGQTFTTSDTAPLIHVDHHVLWINPRNPNHMLLGNDGGLNISYQGGKNWDFIDNLPIGQYYAISIDNRDPYWVYGGLQDNGVWGVASRTYFTDGILNEHTVTVCGGDGFYSAADPRDYNLVYAESQNGGLVLTDLKTGARNSIKPRPQTEGETYRFNWNTPLFLSPHNLDNLYFGGNKLFKTSDQGQTWKEISPDLSKNENLDDILIMGLKPARKPYAALTAIAESPLQQGLIYAGADDGNVHVTKNDGAEWEDITRKFPLPQDRFVTRVLPSHHDDATAYIAFARYWEADDFSPYLFKTTDYGSTWTDVTGDMPEMASIKGFAEHPNNPNLLFAGIHNGLLVSIDGWFFGVG